jgi:hypothetical protein
MTKPHREPVTWIPDEDPEVETLDDAGELDEDSCSFCSGSGGGVGPMYRCPVCSGTGLKASARRKPLREPEDED